MSVYKNQIYPPIANASRDNDSDTSQNYRLQKIIEIKNVS